MISNFFITALRNLIRYRVFATLNILGLTLGISCALFIFLIVKFELSYDTYHDHAERIYRINAGGPNDRAEDMDSGTPHALATYLRKDFPEVEQIGIAFKLNPENTQVEVNHELTRVKELYFVDPGFLKIFKFNWLNGSASTQLKNANEAAVSKSIADKLFKGEALGKTIRVNNATDFIITGVFDNAPLNSDFPFEVMLSHKTMEQDKNGYFPDKLDAGWNSYYHTYVLLNPNSKAEELRPKFKAMIEKYVNKDFAEKQMAFAPFPLTENHFKNDNFNGRTISHSTINILRVIGITILVIACINFINLTTAQAVRRAKEVGVRKTLGSSRKSLIVQFLSETFVVTILALFLSIIVVSQLASLSNTLIEIPLSPEGLTHKDTIFFMIALLLAVTLLAGFYPAFVISRFRPAVALKSLSTDVKGITLRKGLIATQFMVSQALIIGTIIVILQVRHFETMPLGFNKQDVLTTDLPLSDKAKLSTLRNSLLQYPEIKGVTFSLNTPAATINKWWDSFEHASSPGEKKSTELKIIDSLYIGLFEIQKLAGTLTFTPGNQNQIIVNESFIQECGIQNPEQAIGEKVRMWGQEPEIIGVVKNFQTVTLHEGMHAVVLTPSSGPYLMKASLKIERESREQAIAHLEKHWKETFPNYYFTYSFLDDSLNTFYNEDRKVARLLGIFSFIAISIGCLGLFGLIMYAAVQRTKEVGIRKILGATMRDIITLLSKDFVILILIASACAWPVSYYLMNKWLEEFVNSIKLADNLWVFGLAGLISLVLALITVSHQALKAALTNPTESLRTE